MANTKKNLSDLTLLDRFLFAEAVEDPEIMQLLLEIILEREVRLDAFPRQKRKNGIHPGTAMFGWTSGPGIWITASTIRKYRNAIPATCPSAAATTRATSM